MPAPYLPRPRLADTRRAGLSCPAAPATPLGLGVMSEDIPIPSSLNNLTAGWCQQVLEPHFSGELTDVRVLPIQSGRLGATARLALDWRTEPGPTSVIIKLAASSARTRWAARAFRGYEIETGFYLDCAPTLGSLVPRCYWADYDRRTDSFCLMLEDVPTRPIQHGRTAFVREESVAVVRSMAKLHAHTNVLEPAPPKWLEQRSARLSSAEAARHAVTLAPHFTRRLGPELSEEVYTCLGRLSEQTDDLAASTALTLIHGDLRADNILFSETGPVLVDWQTAAIGAPMADLSYFVGTSVADEERTRNHDLFLSTYIDSAARAGVEYNRDDCYRDYSSHAYTGLVMAIVAWALVSRSPESDRMFVSMANRAASHASELCGG